MRLALLACAVAFAVTGLAFAQQQISPQARAPALSVNQISPRYLELLRNAGITTPPTGIRAPVRVSVSRPVQPNAVLSFFVVNNMTPSRDSDGLAILRGNPENSDQSWVQISFEADATSRYIIDCEVGGPLTTFEFARYTGEGAARRREETRVTVSNGRVGMVMQPRGSIGWNGMYLLGMGDTRNWQFRACEIVPVG